MEESAQDWPTQEIESKGVAMLIVGGAVIASASVLGAIMFFLNMGKFDWSLGVLAMMGCVLTVGCFIAAIVLPMLIRVGKINELKNVYKKGDSPKDFAGRILETIMSLKIVQLAMLNSAASGCFMMTISEPSWYLIIAGVVSTMALVLLFPRPGFMENRFQSEWSELSGKAVL